MTDVGDGDGESKRRDLLVARSGSIEIHGNITGSGGANPTNISIDGALEAAVKSFVIPHPTKPGNKLKYGVDHYIAFPFCHISEL